MLLNPSCLERTQVFGVGLTLTGGSAPSFGRAGFRLLRSGGPNPEFLVPDPDSRLRQKFKSQPFTLIFENDRIAVPGRGLPIHVAGRNVVKINMFLIWVGRSFN